MKKMRTAFVFLLVAAMLFSTPVLASAEELSATATAQGLDETVTVTLTMEDGKITGVEASTDKEEVTVGAQALEQLPAAMLEQNTVKVDGVTGATATSTAVISAATAAYLQLLGVDVNLDALAKGQGYVKAEDYQMVTGVDAITSATESGVGGINFGDIDLSDEMKQALILDYLNGAKGDYREMYQIAPSYNNMTLFGSSERNTAKLNNMNLNPNVDLYWTRQIRVGDICSEAMPVLPSYFMSYGVQITGTFKAIHFAELSEDEVPVYLAKARTYFTTLDTTAQLSAMDDEGLYGYLCTSNMNFYQIIPSRIVVTSPWFLNVYDSGYARQFVSEELQEQLAAVVAEQYPEATGLTVLDFATFSATGLKTQQVLSFDR